MIPWGKKLQEIYSTGLEVARDRFHAARSLRRYIPWGKKLEKIHSRGDEVGRDILLSIKLHSSKGLLPKISVACLKGPSIKLLSPMGSLLQHSFFKPVAKDSIKALSILLLCHVKSFQKPS